MRFILKILLIIIICFSISPIPIDTSIINFSHNFSEIFSYKNNESTEIEYIYSTNLNEDTVTNPTNIEFIMTGKFDKGPYIITEDFQIILEVFEEENLIQKYVDNEIVTKINDVKINRSQLSYSLDISQENLNLSSGKYRFNLYSTLEGFQNIQPYTFNVEYINFKINENAQYISAEDNVEDNYMYLKLYFIDDSYNYLVPVSRKIPYTDQVVRSTIENLKKGPHESLGLYEGSPIPDVPRVWVSNGTASLHLPSDLGIFNQGSTPSYFALNTFVNSLTSIYGIDRVEFLQNGRRVETMFHGTDVSKPFERDNSPYAYLALATKSDRYLLVPIKINARNNSINDITSKIFNTLTSAKTESNTYEDLYATIPNNVRLINSSFENGILTLNFSKDFIESYNNRIDLKKMMLDSILYSFTSIPKVNKVAILVDGDVISSFADIDISQPLAAPDYINIEISND